MMSKNIRIKDLLECARKEKQWLQIDFSIWAAKQFISYSYKKQFIVFNGDGDGGV